MRRDISYITHRGIGLYAKGYIVNNPWNITGKAVPEYQKLIYPVKAVDPSALRGIKVLALVPEDIESRDVPEGVPLDTDLCLVLLLELFHVLLCDMPEFIDPEVYPHKPVIVHREGHVRLHLVDVEIILGILFKVRDRHPVHPHISDDREEDIAPAVLYILSEVPRDPKPVPLLFLELYRRKIRGRVKHNDPGAAQAFRIIHYLDLLEALC